MKPENIERVKDLLPTSLGSDEVRAHFAKDILRRAIFSARMASAHYLAKLRDVCTAISAGEINAADARAQLLAVLEQMGHSPQDDGGLRNPASIRRLNLILDTQRQMAASVARLSEETEATAFMDPAWELVRMGTRRVPREDWPARWNAAGNSVGWEGAVKDRFIALKSSPIWQALGDGAGGFTDNLGNPYPPFAYSSGMDWRAVDRDTCIKLGLVKPDAGDKAGESDEAMKEAYERFKKKANLSPDDKDLIEATERYGFDNLMEDLK